MLPALSLILLLTFSLPALTVISGCGYEPDTSVPQRTEIDRSADWHGALLYVADENGPTPGWGSIRVYDNVSGFVEKTVEQTAAAAPADVFVTPDGSSMYVASKANGRIDKFRWDGNNWNPGTVTIDTPAGQLLALVKGPDGLLYAADGAPANGVARLLAVDPAADRLTGGEIDFPGYTVAHGAAWSIQGSQLFVPVTGPRGSGLLFAAWPGGTVTGYLSLPAASLNEAVTSLDGRFVYVMARGEIFQVDAANRTLVASIKPAPKPDTDYYGADFSADGRFLFVTATPPASDSTLYIISLADNSVASAVKHISVKANGVKRAE